MDISRHHICFINSTMELQKHLQIKREQFENIVKAFIQKNAVKVGYSYNDHSVFLWGDESLIQELKKLSAS